MGSLKTLSKNKIVLHVSWALVWAAYSSTLNDFEPVLFSFLVNSSEPLSLYKKLVRVSPTCIPLHLVAKETYWNCESKNRTNCLQYWTFQRYIIILIPLPTPNSLCLLPVNLTFFLSYLKCVAVAHNVLRCEEMELRGLACLKTTYRHNTLFCLLLFSLCLLFLWT